MSETFCAAMFRHVNLLPDGLISPCCYFESHKSDFNNFYIQNIGLEDAFKSEQARKIQSDMVAGNKISGCEKCYMVESNGGLSGRQKFNKRLSLAPLLHETYIESMDLSVGNFCNLRCRSCTSLYSSKWENLNGQLEIHKKFPMLQGSRSSLVGGLSDNVLKNLKKCNILGGEPILIKEFSNLLTRIIDLENFNCTLTFSTNCTTIPSPEIIMALKKFKHVVISLSIDGLGIENEILRPPHKWKDVEEIAMFWLDLARQSENLQINLATTVSAYNVLTYPKLIKWWTDLADLPPSKKTAYICQLFDPPYLRVGVLPAAVKNRIKILLAEQMNFLDNDLRAYLTKDLISLLSINSEEYYPDFISGTRELDSLDGSSSFLVFSELAQMLES